MSKLAPSSDVPHSSKAFISRVVMHDTKINPFWIFAEENNILKFLVVMFQANVKQVLKSSSRLLVSHFSAKHVDCLLPFP